MLISRTRRHLLPAVIVAAVSLGAPAAAHAASPHPPAGPPRGDRPPALVAPAAGFARPRRGDADAPSIGAV